MILHAMNIIVNELNKHFIDQYSVDGSQLPPQADLGNPAEGLSMAGGPGIQRDMLHLSLVNIREEKTLKNMQHYVRNESAEQVSYENPPVFLNLLVLLTATHAHYESALLSLSRTIRFFQAKNVFTQDNVGFSSLSASSGGSNPLDQLESFKLIFDLYSPSMEEVNHLWGTLGGKQYPFVMYIVRMLQLKTRMVQHERPVVTETAGNHGTAGTGIS